MLTHTKKTFRIRTENSEHSITPQDWKCSIHYAWFFPKQTYFALLATCCDPKKAFKTNSAKNGFTDQSAAHNPLVVGLGGVNGGFRQRRRARLEAQIIWVRQNIGGEQNSVGHGMNKTRDKSLGKEHKKRAQNLTSNNMCVFSLSVPKKTGYTLVYGQGCF